MQLLRDMWNEAVLAALGVFAGADLFETQQSSPVSDRILGIQAHESGQKLRLDNRTRG